MAEKGIEVDKYGNIVAYPLTYRGRPVTELSRKELIEALECCARLRRAYLGRFRPANHR